MPGHSRRPTTMVQNLSEDFIPRAHQEINWNASISLTGFFAAPVKQLLVYHGYVGVDNI